MEKEQGGTAMSEERKEVEELYEAYLEGDAETGDSGSWI